MANETFPKETPAPWIIEEEERRRKEKERREDRPQLPIPVPEPMPERREEPPKKEDGDPEEGYATTPFHVI